MGEVYQALDTRLDREVALKILPADLAKDADRLERFTREAKAAAAINHPNIVTLFSVEEHEGVQLLTMELVDGETLESLRPAEGFPTADILNYSLQLSEALTAAHDRGIIHRDLKPANIMIGPEERLKVLDFGLAKAVQDGSGNMDASQAQTVAPATGAGMIMGTIPYMAPEQLKGEPGDARTDLFALGIILYEMAAGRRPFTGASLPETMAGILKEDPVPIGDVREELPRELCRIIHRCLSKDPNRRYQSSRDLRNDLEDLKRELEWGRTTPAPVLSLESGYAKLPLTQYRLSRIAEWSRPRYRLDREFVSLTLLVDEGEDASAGRWARQEETYSGLTELLEVDESPALVLLGPPGSGKSTLLRRVEMDLAQRGLDDPETAMTFFVQLNQYKAAEAGEKLDPLAWLSHRWSARHESMPPLKELLATGKVILLLDALNEAPVAPGHTLHKVVLEWRDFLERLVEEFPGNRVVFSCRALDYSAPLSTPRLPVPQVEIKPLTHEQVQQFLLKQSPDHGASIWTQIKNKRQLDALRSPYFLSLLVDQAESAGYVPQSRAALFTGFVRQALRREIERGNPLFAPSALLSERDLRRITQKKWRSAAELPDRGSLIPSLSKLAMAMQEQGGGGGQIRIDYDDALDLLEGEEAESILAAGLALSVLDEDQNTQELLFFHQLMQEYFAGRELAQSPSFSRVRVDWCAQAFNPSLTDLLSQLPAGETLPRIPSTGWEETVLMAAAMVKDVDGFLNKLMEANLPLAGRAARQPEVYERASQSVLESLNQTLAARSADVNADLRARISAGLVLGHLDDPRFKVVRRSRAAFVEPQVVPVDAGDYSIGQDVPMSLLGQETLFQAPRHTVALQRFSLAKSLLTNREWALFMEDGGYENEKLWTTEAARRWRSGTGTSDGNRNVVRYWLAKFKQNPAALEEVWERGEMPKESYERWKARLAMSPDEFEQHLEELYPEAKLHHPSHWYDSRFNNPAFPVVGICWYEAMAYCNWLSMVSGRSYRLPTEAEWEAAAGDAGGPAESGGPNWRGNTAEMHLQGLSPVGVFVEGNTGRGFTDLFGNAEEWTSSLYGPGQGFDPPRFAYPYNAGDGREDAEASSEVRRVVRGGAWYLSKEAALSACRRWSSPDSRGPGLGFRVCLDVDS